MASFRHTPDQIVLLFVSKNMSYSDAIKSSRERGYTSFIRKQTYYALRRKYKTGKKQQFRTKRGQKIAKTVRWKRIVRKEPEAKKIRRGNYYGIRIDYECFIQVDYWPYQLWIKERFTYKFNRVLDETAAMKEYRSRVLPDFKLETESCKKSRIKRVTFLKRYNAF